MEEMIQDLNQTVSYIQKNVKLKPRLGIILGTGLGSLVNDINIEASLSYSDIPNFPISTVESHKGKLIFGQLANVPVVVMQGRFHYYEGYTMQQITFPVRVMKLLGIEKLFISNAAGGLNPEYQISDLMIIRDHINLLPENPLRGLNIDDLGPRFPDMSNPYDETMIQNAESLALNNNLSVRTGVYVAVQGPNLETDAEYKYLHQIGADAVGMSTIPENIVAKHMGLPCFAVSVITDKWESGNLEKVTIEKVIAAARSAEPQMIKLIMELIKLIY